MASTSRILIVDDDRAVLKFFQAALEGGGYEVTATSSGRQALKLLQTQAPDLLILDLNMPEPDGFDVLKSERAKYPDLRILVISGYLQGALLEAAKIFGAVATLQKPVSQQLLLSTVGEILAS
jgi:CheY-like chemotaxis protein